MLLGIGLSVEHEGVQGSVWDVGTLGHMGFNGQYREPEEHWSLGHFCLTYCLFHRHCCWGPLRGLGQGLHLPQHFWGPYGAAPAGKDVLGQFP